MKLKIILLQRLKKENKWAKSLSKYIAFFFEYFDKSLIVLPVTTGSISIVSLATGRNSKCKF